MKTLPFQLRPGQEFIELSKLLKFMGVTDNGAEAKALVAGGYVTVDGVTEERKACKIHPGQVVETGETRITVAAADQP